MIINKFFLSEYFKILKLATPIILSQILMLSMQFVDTIMAGRYNTIDLAALSLSFALIFPIILFIDGIILAINPLCAHLRGKGENDKIGLLLKEGLLIGLLISIPIIIAIRNIKYLLIILDYPKELIFILESYMNAISWGIPSMFLFLVFRHLNEGMFDNKPNMYIHVIGLGMNILMNYVLIFGNFGFKAMGAVGAGISTTIVWNFMLIIMIFYFIYNKKFLIIFSFKVNFFFLRKFLKLGFPMLVLVL